MDKLKETYKKDVKFQVDALLLDSLDDFSGVSEEKNGLYVVSCITPEEKKLLTPEPRFST